MHLGSPYIEGEEEYSKCKMYKVIMLMTEMMEIGEMKFRWVWVMKLKL